jgi:hypothetical protein
MILRKKVLIFSVFIIPVLLLCLGLNYSSRFNYVVFSKIVNPYNPLLVKNSLVKQQIADSVDYWQDPRGLFPIVAYNTPDNSKNLTSSLELIEKGGANILINGNTGWMPDPIKVNKALEKLGNTKLELLVDMVNDCLNDYIHRNSNDETNSHIKHYLDEFDVKYVYGWYIWDEPGENRKACSPFNLIPNDDNADINRMAKQIRSDSTFNKTLDFVNLFPIYWDGTPTASDYKNYIDAFIKSQEFKPRILCFDYYPFLKPQFGGFRRDYYLNLDIMRKKSIQYNIPFWIMLLSSEHLDYQKPTFESISFQVYSALAYGVKGIIYYLYSKSWEKNGYKSWILENNVDDTNVADSLHGPLFLPVEKLNSQIQALGKTLLNLDAVEVVHSSDYPNKQRDISESILSNIANKYIKNVINAENISSDPEVLVGILKARNSAGGNGTYLLVVNKNLTLDVNIDLILYNSMHIYKIDKANGERAFINESDTINTGILPGAGELYYIE